MHLGMGPSAQELANTYLGHSSEGLPAPRSVPCLAPGHKASGASEGAGITEQARSCVSWATSALTETWAPTPTHQNQDSNSVTHTHKLPTPVYLPAQEDTIDE